MAIAAGSRRSRRWLIEAARVSKTKAPPTVDPRDHREGGATSSAIPSSTAAPASCSGRSRAASAPVASQRSVRAPARRASKAEADCLRARQTATIAPTRATIAMATRPATSVADGGHGGRRKGRRTRYLIGSAPEVSPLRAAQLSAR